MNNESQWRRQAGSDSALSAPSEIRPGTVGARADKFPPDEFPPNEYPRDTLGAYGNALARRKGMLTVAALAGALLGWLVSLPRQPVYQARVSLEVQATNVDPLAGGAPKSSRPASRSAAEFYIATQADLLRSRTLLTRVADKLGDAGISTPAAELAPPAWLPRGFVGWVSGREGRGAPESLGIEALSDRYRIEPSRRSGLVEIVSEWPEAETAARFANLLAAEFIRLDGEVRREKAAQTEKWLTRQLDKLRGQLEGAEEELRRYARETGLMFTSSDGSVAEQRLSQLQAELSRAQADRIQKQSRYEMASGSAPGELNEMLEPASYQIERSALERLLARLTTAYKPAHRKVREARAELEVLKAVIAAERDERLDQIRNEFETARGREGMLETDYGRQARLVSRQAGKSVHYNILRREVDTYRRLYEHLLRRVGEAGLRTATSVGNIRVVDRAAAAAAPVRPDRVMNASLGGVFGLLAGIGLVFVRHRGDDMLREPGDARQCLQLPELGVIPAHENRANRYVRVVLSGSNERSRSKSAMSIRYGKRRVGKGPVELASWRERNSAVAEAFRTTATSVMPARDERRPLRTVLVAAAGPGEGKTTVAANLAITLAQIYERVLLIDADLRRPRLHEVFELPNAWGLSDLLKDSPEVSGSGTHEFGLLTDVPGLYVLPSGPSVESVTTLLHAGKTKMLIDRMLDTFDWVVFDTPPMANFSETRALGRITDAVVLVARLGCCSRQDLQFARRQFSEDGARVLGTVLNHWRATENYTSGSGFVDLDKRQAGFPSPRARAAAGVGS